MSSDDFFFDEPDSLLLAQVDAIEAAAATNHQELRPAPTTTASAPVPVAPAPVQRPPPARTETVIIIPDSDDYNLSGNFDDLDFAALDGAAASVYNGEPPSAFRAHGVGRNALLGSVQTDLHGNVASSSNRPAPVSNSRLQQPSRPAVSRSSFGAPQRKTKYWDHTEFAKSGWKRTKSKGKGKSRSRNGEDEEMEDDSERLPAPFIPIGPPPEMKLRADPLAIKNWVYPLNQPKRDYQFNIVKHSLFENTLVALPTGLGKTFIAGVVMLNFYQWFPGGKVVFVAPTKPLVAQQIEACHRTCGIPGSDAAELTGEIPVSKRERLWEERRVFYLTPQTLINDLSKNVCDPRDIILLVIDEAHKGTGDYAYAQVVRYLMATNPHFRILALTATPGSNPEAVQALINSLHISRIEIRNEDSLDLKAYLHRKVMKQHRIVMTEGVIRVRDLLAKMMDPMLKRLQRDDLLRGAEAVKMHPYRAQAEMSKIQGRADKQRLAYAFMMLKKLSTLARAMGYLLESSVGMCATLLKDISEAAKENGKEGAQAKAIASSPEFSKVQAEIAAQRDPAGRLPLHPKMVELKNLIIQHFGQLMADPGADAEAAAKGSRVMVFAAFREVVDEIVDVLNEERPLIRAMRLIGQGADKQGNLGLNQRAQQEVLDQFKGGAGNVLVATSIGEEGLDIGEIDMVICYDAQKTPIRMLQRIGRTGRKQDGFVHILMAEGREEDNWNKSKEAYENVQRSIVHAEQLEFFADVPRLLPEGLHPSCIEQQMEIEPYTRIIGSSRRGSAMGQYDEDPDDHVEPPAKTRKRKRAEPGGSSAQSIPPDAAAGFQNVRDMLTSAPAKAPKKSKSFDPTAGTDDDTDKEIEAGIHAPPRDETIVRTRGKKAVMKRTASTKESKTPKPRVARKKKEASESAIPISNKVVAAPQTFSQKAQDDSDDNDIENGVRDTLGHRSTTPPPAKVAPSQHTPDWWSPSPERPIHDEVIELSSPMSLKSPAPDNRKSRSRSSLEPLRLPSRTASNSASASPDPPAHRQSSVSATRSPSLHIDSSPEPASPRPDVKTANPSIVVAKFHSPPKDISEEQGNGDISWLLADSDDDVMRVEIVDSSPIVASHSLPRSPSRENDADDGVGMPPPALPTRFTTASSLLEATSPEASFAVGHRKRRVVQIDSSPLAMPPVSQHRLTRLQRRTSSSPPPMQSPPKKKKKKKAKPPVDREVLRQLVDTEAAHSGDELSEGSSGVDEPESESDRRFLHEPGATQVSPSYDQTLAYRRSLFTQVPNGGPQFTHGPVRRGRFGPMSAPRAPIMARSSSLATERDEPDEYEFGSFVVHDEADITYDNDTSEP